MTTTAQPIDTTDPLLDDPFAGYDRYGNPEHRRIPVVYATVDSHGETVRFFCPWCGSHHVHGRGVGHRASHCILAERSPLAETGYFVTVVPVPQERPRFRTGTYIDHFGQRRSLRQEAGETMSEYEARMTARRRGRR